MSRHRNCIESVGIDGRIILKRIIVRYVVSVCVCVLESYDLVAAVVNKVMNFRVSQKNFQEFIVQLRLLCLEVWVCFMNFPLIRVWLFIYFRGINSLWKRIWSRDLSSVHFEWRSSLGVFTCDGVLWVTLKSEAVCSSEETKSIIRRKGPKDDGCYNNSSENSKACIIYTVNCVWSTYTEHWLMILWRMGFHLQLPELCLLPQPVLAVFKMKEKNQLI
jgi:hypothetical protein